MFILNSKKIIFIHIPKCGGESFHFSLAKYFTPIDIQLGTTSIGNETVRVVRKHYGLWKHSTALDLSKIIESNFYDFKICTLCRNPYDRFISLYKYMLKNSEHAIHKKFDLSSIENFAFCPAFNNGFYISKSMASYISPFHDGLTIFKLDNISVEEERIQKFFSIDDFKMQHKNPSNSSKNSQGSLISSNLNKNIIEHINQLWEIDFKVFGYDML
jgi:hypothetical protein